MAPSRAIRPVQTLCAACVRRQRLQKYRFSTTPDRQYAQESNLPRIVSTSFWTSLIPKPFRRPKDPVEAAERAAIKTSESKEWNPATIFIILGVIVGSNAIQMISLRNEMLNFSRKTDAKLALLREVVHKVKNGEDVDVKKALGTGDPQQEAEWEEVMKELESTDTLLEGRKKRDAKRAEKEERRKLREEEIIKAREREGPRQAQGHEVEGGQTANERRPKFLM